MDIKKVLFSLFAVATVVVVGWYVFLNYGVRRFAMGGTVMVLGEMPIGLWKSESPYLIMDIPDDTSVYHHGKYITDGVPMDIVVYVDRRIDEILIFDGDTYDFSTNTFYGHDFFYIFKGRYKVRNGKLRYKISSTTEESVTKRNIIFVNERVND